MTPQNNLVHRHIYCFDSSHHEIGVNLLWQREARPIANVMVLVMTFSFLLCICMFLCIHSLSTLHETLH